MATKIFKIETNLTENGEWQETSSYETRIEALDAVFNILKEEEDLYMDNYRIIEVEAKNALEECVEGLVKKLLRYRKDFSTIYDEDKSAEIRQITKYPMWTSAVIKDIVEYMDGQGEDNYSWFFEHDGTLVIIRSGAYNKKTTTAMPKA